MSDIQDPVDLFNGSEFVQAFRNEDKARKFACNPRRKITNPILKPHDDSNGPIVSAGRKAGGTNTTMLVVGVRTEINPALRTKPVTQRVNWDEVAGVFNYVEGFDDADVPILHPRIDRLAMIDRMEHMY